MKYFVVSDIHSFYDPLIKALDGAGFFESDENKLIVLGDALDRGPDTLRVVDFLLRLHNEERLIYIKGNHEELFMHCLQEISRGDIFEIACGMSVHYTNGTFRSILAIAGMDANAAMSYPLELVSRVRASDYYKILLPSCIDYFETDSHIFVHGYIPCFTEGFRPYVSYKYNPDWRNAELEAWRMARWFNGMEIACKHHVTEPKKTIVVGHWRASYGHSIIEHKCSEKGADADFTPFSADGILAIDAHVAGSGFINCVVIEA